VSSPRGYLLDTNVLSEARKKRADRGVMDFLESCDSSSLYLSVLTIGELRKGIALRERSDGEGAALLRAWVDGLELSFRDRILGIDMQTARQWGVWSAERSRPVIDTLLAATAARHDLALVTRNTRDVDDLKIPMLNPWRE
jgi:predicted nucleic acid-binding protein